jgi:signal peptidase
MGSKATAHAGHRLPGLKPIGLCVTLLTVVIGALWLRPQSLGGRAGYVIVSGRSMQPTLRGGDLVAVRRQSTYRVGDVVTYRIGAGVFRGRRIIHRILGGNATEGFVLRGDNKHEDDLWRPRPSDIEGALWFRLPAVGRAVAFVRTPTAIAAIAGGLAFAFALTWQPRRPPEAEAEAETAYV